MPTKSRGRTLEVTEASPGLAHLDLTGLRAYRVQLNQEEEQVSYWRRLVQARLDLLDASRRKLGSLTHEELVRALGRTGMGASRNVLLRVNSAEPLPELPGLQDLWTHAPDPNDVVAVESSRLALTAAEEQLGKYRHALHARIAEATGELILRYSRAPETCLDLLYRR